MRLLEYSVIIALISAFILILLGKWGVREWIQIHGNKFFSKMADCSFCMGFWISVILSVFFAIITQEVTYLLIPVIASPITRYIL